MVGHDDELGGESRLGHVGEGVAVNVPEVDGIIVHAEVSQAVGEPVEDDAVVGDDVLGVDVGLVGVDKVVQVGDGCPVEGGSEMDLEDLGRSVLLFGSESFSLCSLGE